MMDMLYSLFHSSEKVCINIYEKKKMSYLQFIIPMYWKFGASGLIPSIMSGWPNVSPRLASLSNSSREGLSLELGIVSSMRDSRELRMYQFLDEISFMFFIQRCWCWICIYIFFIISLEVGSSLIGFPQIKNIMAPIRQLKEVKKGSNSNKKRNQRIR